MSASQGSQPDPEPTQPDRLSEHEAAEEVLNGEPVLAGPPRIIAARTSERAGAIERADPASLPAVQAAAVAAGGFIAGAAVVKLLGRHRQRGLQRGARAQRALGRRAGSRKERKTGELLQIVGSRSLLLDVHLLGGER